jgi:hypothetical protein
MFGNVAMHLSRRTVAWWLGVRADREGVVDPLLADVTLGEPVLLVGEASSWPAELARFLHRNVSVRCVGPLTEVVQVPRTRQACMDIAQHSQAGGALVALPDEPTARDRAQLAELVSALLGQSVALYVTARNADVAKTTLGAGLMGRLRMTTIPPLKERLHEMEPVLDGMLRWQNVPLHVHTFAPLLPRMECDLWEGNFDELATLVRNYAALATMGFNEAAEHLQVKRPTLYDYKKRWGLVELTAVRAGPGLDESDAAANDGHASPRASTAEDTYDSSEHEENAS